LDKPDGGNQPNAPTAMRKNHAQSARSLLEAFAISRNCSWAASTISRSENVGIGKVVDPHLECLSNDLPALY
jgi:hypothetical protein